MKLWKRLVCVFRDHDICALVKWSPEVICMHLVCARCGKEVGHMDMPNHRKESVH